VGDDPWGHLLIATLQRAGVNVRGIRLTPHARTALAFVSLQANGERDFVFYRHPSADMLYEISEVDEECIARTTLFHCGSISLISEPSRSATLHAVAHAHHHGVLVSYDPNLRLALWPDEATARTRIGEMWKQAHIIKVSDDELRFLSGDKDIHQAARQVWHTNLRLLAVTQGAAGCTYFTAAGSGSVGGYQVQTMDTTGAGDSWMAALLVHIARNPTLWENQRQLEDALHYANAAGALTTTQRGAIPALPTDAQVRTLLHAPSPLPTLPHATGDPH
jgi:fructokinase